MISLAFILAFMAASVGLIIGVLVVGSVTDSIDCPDPSMYADGARACEGAKSNAYIVVAILPIAMFFATYILMGGVDSKPFDSRTLHRNIKEAKEVGGYVTGGSNTVLKRVLLSIGLARKVKKE